jgi:hypothetical protein
MFSKEFMITRFQWREEGGTVSGFDSSDNPDVEIPAAGYLP